MPKSTLIGPVCIDIGDGTTGVIQICRNGPNKFKATCKTLSGRRLFGTIRHSIVGALEQLVNSKLTSVSIAELRRVTSHVEALSHTKDVAMQRCQIDAVPLVVMDNRVKVFHQIWGIFGDGSEMPALFRESQAKWKNVAANNGAIYHS